MEISSETTIPGISSEPTETRARIPENHIYRALRADAADFRDFHFRPKIVFFYR